MAILGKYVNIDYGKLELTPELSTALWNLDASCRDGCGGTWEIFEEKGGTWRAVFVDIATDELVWDADDGSWNYDYGDDDYDDEDEEDDEDLAAS